MVLDVRSAEAFTLGHPLDAGHIPIEELKARQGELPPQETGIAVVAESGARARDATRILGGFGYRALAWLDGAPGDLEAEQLTRAPARRLWRPAPFLEESLPLLPRGRALDLAAGSGRDAVFLALHGFQVEAWDHDPEALGRAQALAARHGVGLEVRCVDLEVPDPGLAAGRYSVICMFRFLYRPLFPAVERALTPGGALLVETFRKGQERFGRPRRPRFLLEERELERAFPSLVVERYEEPSPPEGPWLARLLARRPAAG